MIRDVVRELGGVVEVEGSSVSKEELTIRYLNCSSNAVSSASGSDELM